MTEEDLQKWRRAREVLDSAGWVFDEFVNKQMAQILLTGADDVEGRRSGFGARVPSGRRKSSSPDERCRAIRGGQVQWLTAKNR
jgi:hypothetical protein